MPARRQKRLFDDTREAEKVLQFLVDLSPGDAAQLVLPTLLQAAVVRILEEQQQEHRLSSLLADGGRKLVDLSHLPCLPEVRHYRGNVGQQPEFARRAGLCADVGKILELAELRVSQALSLRKKFVYDMEAFRGEEEEQPDALAEMER